MKALIAIAVAVLAMALAGPALGDPSASNTLPAGRCPCNRDLPVNTSNDQGVRFITDTLAPGGGSSSQQQGYRFITDTLAPGGGTSTVVQAPRTFSWSDAGVGAGTAAGAILVLIGSSLIVIRRQGRLVL